MNSRVLTFVRRHWYTLAISVVLIGGSVGSALWRDARLRARGMQEAFVLIHDEQVAYNAYRFFPPEQGREALLSFVTRINDVRNSDVPQQYRFLLSDRDLGWDLGMTYARLGMLEEKLGHQPDSELHFELSRREFGKSRCAGRMMTSGEIRAAVAKFDEVVLDSRTPKLPKSRTNKKAIPPCGTA